MHNFLPVSSRCFLRYFIILFLLLVPQKGQAESLKEAISGLSANVVFMRHALAPGYGDPANFKIDDCSTQRNLDQIGREQARAIGQAFRDYGISFDLILSSEWCRCKETADELGLGVWTGFDGLNSFFQGYAKREETLAKLRAKLDSLPPDILVLMVTHQVVINAVTGNSVGSGGIVIYNTKTADSRSMGVISR